MEPDAAQKAAIEGAMAVGTEYVESLQVGQRPRRPSSRRGTTPRAPPCSTRSSRCLGLDRVTWAGSASAPMPVEVARFFAGLGPGDLRHLRDDRDLWRRHGVRAGRSSASAPSAGRCPGIELRIADDGEVLMRGPITTVGLPPPPRGHRRPSSTTTAGCTPATSAPIDDDGFLSIVDRKKELIITSAGKNIAPSNIESLLKESPIVGHALAFGDNRPYVVAVLTLDGEVAPVVARTRGIEFTDLADLAAKPEILAMAQAAVDSANARLSRPEQVKSFELLPTEWTAESEELTPTLKLKRRVVHAKYADVIDRLYG